MKIFTILLALFLSGCAALLPIPPKGILVKPYAMIQQKPIDALISCMVPIYAKAKQPLIVEGITIKVENTMRFKAYTLNGNHIWIRSVYPDGTQPSIGTVGSLIAHELSHVTSERMGKGPDAEHLQWNDGHLEKLEDAAVDCMLLKLNDKAPKL
jgi:hypothetical protein